MIIRWTFDEGYEKLTNTPNFLTTVSEILRAHRTGAHLLVIDRQIAQKLAKLPLAQHEISLINRLNHEYTQTGRIHIFSTSYIQIENKIAGEPTLHGSAYLIPFGLISSTNILEKSSLIVENIDTDGWILSEIIKIHSELSGRGHVAIELMHGGGADMPKVAKSVAGQRRIACVVADSDKRCPTSAETDTNKKIKAIPVDLKWPLLRHTILPCKETENLIPLDLILELPCALENSSKSVLMNVFTKEILSNCHNGDFFVRYFDYKEGISPIQLDKWKEYEANWVKMKLDGVVNLEDPWHLPGFGSTILSQLQADGKHIASLRRMVRVGLWKEMYGSIFSTLAWFFASAKPLVT